MADLFPRKARLKILEQKMDFVAGTVNNGAGNISAPLKVMLLRDTYTENQAHEFIDGGGANDPVDHEVSVAGYSRQALVSPAVSDDGTRVKLTTTGGASWASLAAGQTVRFALLFMDTGVATTSRVVGVFQVTDLILNGSPVNLNQPANGWLNF